MPFRLPVREPVRNLRCQELQKPGVVFISLQARREPEFRPSSLKECLKESTNSNQRLGLVLHLRRRRRLLTRAVAKILEPWRRDQHSMGY